jgi:hypothetical protein
VQWADFPILQGARQGQRGPVRQGQPEQN